MCGEREGWTAFFYAMKWFKKFKEFVMKVLNRLKNRSKNKHPLPENEIKLRIQIKKAVENGIESDFWTLFLKPALEGERGKADNDLAKLSATREPELITQAQSVVNLMNRLNAKINEAIQKGQLAEEQLNLLEEQKKLQKEEA